MTQQLRCPRCGALLAESLEGKVAITCRRCHTVAVFIKDPPAQPVPANGKLRGA